MSVVGNARIRRLTVPMPTIPAATYAGVIRVNDIATIAAGAGRPLAAGVVADAAADELDQAAIRFVLASRIEGATPAGELGRWCREVERRARDLLAAFEIENPGDWQPSNAAGSLFRPRAPQPGETIPGDPDDLLNDAIDRVRLLARAGRIAAEIYEGRKGSRRRAPAAELVFVRALRQAFERIFGIAGGLGGAVSDNGRPGGPLVRFIVAVVEIIATRLPDPDLRRDRVLLLSLNRLREPERVRERLRDVPKGGEPLRKR